MQQRGQGKDTPTPVTAWSGAASGDATQGCPQKPPSSDPHGHTRTWKVNRNGDVEIIRFPSDKTLVLHNRLVAGSTSAGVPGSPGAGEGTSPAPQLSILPAEDADSHPLEHTLPMPLQGDPLPGSHRVQLSSGRRRSQHPYPQTPGLHFTEYGTLPRQVARPQPDGFNHTACRSTNQPPAWAPHPHAPPTHSRGALLGKRERQNPVLKAPWDPLPVRVPFSCPGSDLMLQPKQLGDVPPRSGQRPLGLPRALLRNGETEPGAGGGGGTGTGHRGHAGGGKGSVE